MGLNLNFNRLFNPNHNYIIDNTLIYNYYVNYSLKKWYIIGPQQGHLINI